MSGKDHGNGISIVDVSKWYGTVMAVNHVNLHIGSGITGLIGPNGSGKSTLMKLITGQAKPSIGTVKIKGHHAFSDPRARTRIGYSPQVDRFYEDMTPYRFVYTMGRLSGLSMFDCKSKTRAALDRVNMSKDAYKPLRRCSKGMRQRVKIAQALVHDPDVLILDEPLDGIDPAGRQHFMELFDDLRSHGKTLLISSHILEELQSIADRVALIVDGRLMAWGSVNRIRELMDDRPLTIRIECDQPRALASALANLYTVVGLRTTANAERTTSTAEADLEEIASTYVTRSVHRELIVEVRQPERFFNEIPKLLLQLDISVEAMEPLDSSVSAIFEYVVDGPRGANS